jgi:hypothetical protein
MTTETSGRRVDLPQPYFSGFVSGGKNRWRRVLILGQRILAWRRARPHRLRLCETLPLGDCRFVAVVELEQSRFLLGGTVSSMVLLARLEDSDGRGQAGSGQPGGRASAAERTR